MRAAQATAWRFVLTAWALLALVSVRMRSITAASVTRRVRTLIARLESGQQPTPKAGDELAALSLALDEAIRSCLERDRAQSARYQELVDNAPYGICRLDQQHRITAGNPALARMIGVEPAGDLVGREHPGLLRGPEGWRGDADVVRRSRGTGIVGLSGVGGVDVASSRRVTANGSHRLPLGR